MRWRRVTSNRDGALDLAVAGAPGGGASGTARSSIFALPAFENVSAASGSPGVQAPDSIISAYGARLATETAASPSPDWPTTLGGSRVRVLDAAGVERNARVAFASRAGQLRPAGRNGLRAGTVRITAATATRPAPRSRSSAFAPGCQGHPEGLAAAWVIRAKPDGQQLLEPVVEVNARGQVVAAPIDLSDDADVMVLQLYGTGLRGGST